MCQQCSIEPKIISENTIIVQKYTHQSQIKFTHYCGIVEMDILGVIYSQTLKIGTLKYD